MQPSTTKDPNPLALTTGLGSAFSRQDIEEVLLPATRYQDFCAVVHQDVTAVFADEFFNVVQVDDVALVGAVKTTGGQDELVLLERLRYGDLLA